jgi:F0F1-type ATP synthase membrane subunit b/b'
MDKTLHDLGGIVLNGLPTFFLVLILAIIFRFLYIKPLDKVLAERYRLTEGARKAAEESLKNADSKIGEYQEALNKARAEIYHDQATFLQQIQVEQAQQLREARRETEQRVAAMKLSLAHEADAAREGLEAQAQLLASQIAAAILKTEAAA